MATAGGVAPYFPKERKTISVPACVKQERARVAREVSEAIEEWQAETVQKARDLGEKFGKKPEYFLSLFYGEDIKDSERKVRALSLRDAWLWDLAEQHTFRGGGRQQLFDLQREHKHEYEALKEEGKETEREELLQRYKEHKDSEEQGRRVTPRSMSMVVYNGCKQIEEKLTTMRKRAGIEAVLIVVRNNMLYDLNPVVYFTSAGLEAYMPIAVGRVWDAVSVAARCQAFAIARCSIDNLGMSHKKMVEVLKAQIREQITRKLIDATGNERAVMNYTNTHREIVMKYGIRLEGWSHKKWANPSELGSQLGPLQTLLKDLRKDKCRFVKCTPQELQDLQEKYEKDIADGKIEVKERKTRCDAGQKRKQMDEDEDEDSDGADDGSDDDEQPPPKKARGAKATATKVANKSKSGGTTKKASASAAKGTAKKTKASTNSKASNAAASTGKQPPKPRKRKTAAISPADVPAQLDE
ncbi:hypothetical protein SCHPADRAFT_945183 [Schizopora paradoxa]|uniref:Uncharacterized protein n=1 Tax=Schizopora paradoxa TaxID=27342 RepID=A0A0H2R6U8_9AGAM|nr:hypothetical protein SCHPADRAFT_945183 [Schizopora paradoxa]